VASGGQRTARVLKGFRDYLPEQMILRGRIIGRFREVFERHGFEPLDTPTIEYLEVLTGKAGENEKLMYRFADHGGREVGLRYDLTVPLARVVAMHQNDLCCPSSATTSPRFGEPTTRNGAASASSGSATPTSPAADRCSPTPRS
jgi:histidyl-tRNA synthetase